jgi:hypothetical protein
MSDILKRIQQRKEELARQVLALENPELQKKIEDYRFWSNQLPILKKEIEALIGESLEEEVTAKTASNRGRKKGAPRLVDAEVEAKIAELLRASVGGLAASEIAAKIHSVDWPDRPLSSIYQRVSKILNADQQLAAGSRKYRKTGELRNTKWFAVVV